MYQVFRGLALANIYERRRYRTRIVWAMAAEVEHALPAAGEELVRTAGSAGIARSISESHRRRSQLSGTFRANASSGAAAIADDCQASGLRGPAYLWAEMGRVIASIAANI